MPNPHSAAIGENMSDAQLDVRPFSISVGVALGENPGQYPPTNATAWARLFGSRLLSSRVAARGRNIIEGHVSFALHCHRDGLR